MSVRLKRALFTFPLIGLFATAFATSPRSGAVYLAKPTGTYGVGFQNVHLQDNTRCPDVFYQANVNESDFSSSNSNHCREIMVRIYYPSSTPVAHGNLYYAPLIQRFVNNTSDAPGVKPEDVQEFYKLQSYSTENAKPVLNKKFPVVLFSHGSGGAVEEYENQITNLVSHGYVVVGVNSFFVGSYIALPTDSSGNAHVVLQQKAADEVNVTAEVGDLKYVYSAINQLPANVLSIMDVSKLGLLGHSYGGRAVTNLSDVLPNAFKAVVTDDAYYDDAKKGETSVIINGSNVPLLRELSGTNGINPSTLNFTLTYALNNDNYLVGLAPDDATLFKTTAPFYTSHPEFSDEGTLKNMPAMKQWAQDIYDAMGLMLYGTASSSYTINAINVNAVSFFDFYLKRGGQGRNPFAGCIPLVKGTILKCGPTSYGPFPK